MAVVGGTWCSEDSVTELKRTVHLERMAEPRAELGEQADLGEELGFQDVN